MALGPAGRLRSERAESRREPWVRGDTFQGVLQGSPGGGVGDLVRGRGGSRETCQEAGRWPGPRWPESGWTFEGTAGPTLFFQVLRSVVVQVRISGLTARNGTSACKR